MKLIDLQTIKGSREGDHRCQRLIVDTYAPHLLSICNRYCGNIDWAHDALQDTFISAFKYLHSFDTSKSFDAWIKKIAVNASLAIINKNKRYAYYETDALEIHTDAQIPDVYADISTEEILSLLQLLPQSLRVVFNLYIVEGYSHDEISEMLSITNATSRAHLAKARTRLIEILKKQREHYFSHQSYQKYS